jgi:RNA polymerase sigma factor (TIGR02999 family)
MEVPTAAKSVIIPFRFGMNQHKGDVTLLLERLSEGDRSAEDALMQRVYVELHRLAVARLRTERPGHTLQPTALVNEAYLRMCRSEQIKCLDRSHFFRIAATTMRRVLVDHARCHGAQKRASSAQRVPLEEAIAISPRQSAEALEVDELLDILAESNPRAVQVVEMRFYAGLSEEEIAVVLDLSARTVKRDWLLARAWLHERLRRS